MRFPSIIAARWTAAAPVVIPGEGEAGIETYDYVIVGGGSAGCVLANRLSADDRTRVVLLEAGGEHDRTLINTPLGYGKTIYMPEYSWQIFSAPEPKSNGRRYYHPRGRLLGGSSAINGLLYVRGQPQDYDDWAASGAAGWSWEDCKPYFLRAEDQARGADDWHGTGGPLRVEDIIDTYPIEHTLIEAAQTAGFERNEDFNGARQAGVGFYQTTMKAGRRWSAAHAYLDPARARPNLTVFTGAHAERVVIEDGRARGVVARVAGEIVTFGAAREVLLAAGAFGSPHLLQLSGVGAGALLQSLDIEVLVDNPAVGANLHDHNGAPMSWRFRDAADSLNRRLRPPRLLLEALRYLFRRRGLLTMPSASVGMFVDSRMRGGRPDLQFHCLAVSGDVEAEVDRNEQALDSFPGLTMMPYPLRPRSRGQVRAKSPDPNELPQVIMNYLSDPYDMRVLLRGMRIAQRIAASEPLASRLASPARPGPELESDAQLEDFARRYGHTGYHPVGSCRMGEGADTVVDCQLRVRGVAALRVVDASIMPAIPSGNTNAPVIMIAEKAADLIMRARP